MPLLLSFGVMTILLRFGSISGYVVKNLMSPFKPEILSMKRSYDPYHTPKVSARMNVFFVKYQILNQCTYFIKGSRKSGFVVNLLSQEENIRSSWNFRYMTGVIKPFHGQNLRFK